MDNLGSKFNAEAMSSQRSSEQSTTPKVEVMKQAQLLLGCYRMADAANPEIYSAAVVAVLSDYPMETIWAVVDPRSGLPGKVKWLPTIAEIKEACEDHYRIRRYSQNWTADAQKILAERDLLAIPDYRPKSLGVPQYTYAEFMEMTGGKGRPVGRFEIKSDFAKEGERRGPVEAPKIDSLNASPALLKALEAQGYPIPATKNEDAA